MPETVSKVATFLNKFPSDQEVKRLAEHLDIENFRKNGSVNRADFKMDDLDLANPNEQLFIRTGETSDDLPNEYTPQIAERFKAWYEKNLRETTLRFPE